MNNSQDQPSNQLLFGPLSGPVNMKVYVDDLRVYPKALIQPKARMVSNTWCHMWCDQGNEEALHEIAKSIGMKSIWFQDKPGFPHYDLVPRRRHVAIRFGAMPRNLRDWIAEKRKRRCRVDTGILKE